MSVGLSESREHAPFECLPTRLGRLGVDDVEDLDGAVGRTRGESFSVVVELGIVDHVVVRGFDWDRIGGRCANHVVERGQCSCGLRGICGYVCTLTNACTVTLPQT